MVFRQDIKDNRCSVFIEGHRFVKFVLVLILSQLFWPNSKPSLSDA